MSTLSTFRILVADDHPVFRFGLCSLLGSREGWEVCGEASDGREALEKCKLLKPDLVILDICMPKLNGVDAAVQIMKDNPSLRIMVLTDVDSEEAIRDCLNAGVRGWIFKSEGTHDLIAAVQSLQNNRFAFSSQVSTLVLNGYLQRHQVGAAPHRGPKLSSREREVVQLIAEGSTTKQVATTLNIATKTAETHRSNLMYKLNIHSIAELVLYAVRNEIVQVRVPPGLRIPSTGYSPTNGVSPGLD